MRVYILSGSTGNLASTSLVPKLLALGCTVFATRHTIPANVGPKGVQYISHGQALDMVRRANPPALDCGLWLSPTDSVATVTQFRDAGLPIFAISSMALANHLMTGAPLENDYQRGKHDTVFH